MLGCNFVLVGVEGCTCEGVDVDVFVGVKCT